VFLPNFTKQSLGSSLMITTAPDGETESKKSELLTELVATLPSTYLARFGVSSGSSPILAVWIVCAGPGRCGVEEEDGKERQVPDSET